MKKFLSIILACAMIMSLFTVVPASASSISSETYFVEDFEKGTSDLVANATRVEGGYGSAGYSGRLSKAVTAGTTGRVALNPDLAIDAIAAAVMPSDVISIKFKYKLLYPVAANSKLSVVTTYALANADGSKGTTKYDGKDHVIPAPNDTTNWQTFELTQNMPANMWLRSGQASKNGQYASGFVIRWGTNTSTLGNEIATATTEESTRVGILVDDIEITLKENQNDGSTTVLDGTQDIGTYYSTRNYNSKPLDEVVDPLDATNTVYSVQSAKNTTNGKDVYNLMYFYADAPANIGIAPGDTVNFSAKVRVTDNPNPGTKSSKFTLRFYSARSSSTLTALAASGHVNGEVTFNMANREWQTLSTSFTVPEDCAEVLKGVRFWLNDDTNTTTDDNDMKDMGHATFYFDDITYTVVSSACKTPTITGLTAKVDAQGNAKATYTFNKGTGDANGENASIAKFYNAQGAIIKTSDKTTDSMDIPVEYVGQTVTLKMVPVSSNGYIGEEVSSTVVVTDEDIPAEPVILKNVPVLTTTAPTKIALNTTNENAVISDTKASISADVASIFGGGSITVPVDVETAGAYSIKYENVTASSQIRASFSVDGVEQIPYTRLAFLPGNDGSYSGKYKTNEKVGFLDLKEGRNFITIDVDPAYGGAAIISYSITLELANEVDVVDLSIKNNDGPRAIYSTRNGLKTSAEVTLKKYGSVSPKYMLVCAGYNTNNKLTSVNTMTIDCAQLSDKETKTYTTDITLDGSEYVVKAMIMEKSNLRPLTDAEAISTMSLIDDSILDNEVDYQLATETLNNDGEYYRELGVDKADYKIDAIFYEGHNDTKVFAYVGYPKNASPDNKVPAMVLVHGGLGSAYTWWVEKWNKLGFAAIAMCLYGRDPENVTSANTGYVKHPYAGQHPYQLGTSFLPNATEAGMYQNVVAVVNAHNILRDSGVVDTENVGITGISWGGVTTTTVIGVDHRFKFAAPVYGCGFLDQSKTYFKDAFTGGSVHWDPANFAARADMPVLYVNGDEDVNFSIDATSWTCDVTKNGRMSIIHSYPHDEIWGSSVDQVYAYAQAMVQDRDPFITVKNDKVANGKFTATLDIPTGTTVVSAEMYYLTVDEFKFYNGTTTPVPDWQLATNYTLNGSSFEMAVPSDATYLYVTFIDQNGYKMSSKFIKVN